MSGSVLLPVTLFTLLCLADGAALLLRKRPGPPWWSRWVGLAARPLAALALCNAAYRLWPATFKFNPLTFPLWANYWSDAGLHVPGQALRTLAACAACGLVILALRHALTQERQGFARLGGIWLLLVLCQLAVALAPAGWRGVTLPWTAPGKVYAWAARQVDSAGGAAAFLDRYDEIQPRQPVHARSHPPGATLLSRWTQDTVNPAAPSNAVRLLILSSLNLPVIFLMGRSIFDSRTALVAAALFAAMPATIAFGTYSQDTVYAVLFNLYLLLSWRIARRDAARLPAVAAGVVLFLLSMLTFSWSIVAAGAFGFVLLSRLLRRLPLRDALADAGLPPLTLLSLHVATALLFQFDYYASYRESYAFHTRYYRFEGFADWTKALFGGQLDWLWGMGPLVAGIFVGLLVRELVSRPAKPFHLFSLSVLACYGIAVVFGPNPLKLETARCWYWAMSLPVLGAAARLVSGQRDMRPALLAAGCSLAAALISVSFLNFGA